MSEAIHVALRVRPATGCVDSAVQVVKDVVVISGSSYKFDRIFPRTSTQAEVYEAVGEAFLEKCFVEGFNACVFCYGQTGSGKSFTLSGSKSNPGIIPRFLDSLFSNKKIPEMKIWLSYVEIYNERVRDLLAADHDPTLLNLSSSSLASDLTLFDHPDLGVVMPGATLLAVDSEATARNIIALGLRRRAVAETLMNAQSSRSHAVLIVKTEHNRVSSVVNLVDLAGSERVDKSGATGQVFREATSINQSLTHLGQVISSLADKERFVPFRTSKLTFLLRDSLSGNSKTWMIATASEADSELDETISTMRFAQNVKRVNTSAKVNHVKVSHDEIIKKLQAEIKELKDQLQGQSTASVSEGMRARKSIISAFEKSFDKELLDSSKHLTRISDSGGNSPPTGDTPFLVNVSTDPLIDGQLFFSLDPTASLAVGSDHACDIQVRGFGCTPKMCAISADKITVLDKTARILVNGSRITAATTLHPGDSIILGRAFTVRYKAPKDNRKDSLLDDPILRELRDKIGSKQIYKVRKEVESLLPLIDEANELSSIHKKGPNFRFEHEVVFNAEEPDEEVRPEDHLLVRVLTKLSAERANFRTAYLWSVEKFKARLDLMREYSGEQGTDPLCDPWLEAPVVALSKRLSTTDAPAPVFRESQAAAPPRAVTELEEEIKKSFRGMRKYIRSVCKIE